MSISPVTDDGTRNPTPEAMHVHRRDWRPCPYLMPPPMKPRKAIARWYFDLADAIQHEDTWTAFLERERLA